METKVCYKCKLELELSFFSKNKNNKSGFDGRCKCCSKYAAAKWRKENPEKSKDSNRASSVKFYLKNTEKRKAQKRKWYSENIEKNMAYKAQYYLKNTEKYKVNKAKWYSENIEKIKDYSYKYTQKLPNSVVIRYLKQSIGVSNIDIPAEMIEVKRLQIKIKRKLKDIKNENTNRC